jgi:hypothetical protein
MNKALVGVSNNITSNFDKIKVWAKSFMACSEGTVYLVCANATKEELGMVAQLGVKAIPVEESNTWCMFHRRLKHVLDVLKTLQEKQVIITDVFDVIFQSDPFSKLDFNNWDVFIGQEGVLVYESGWNTGNIEKLFPEHLSICRPIPVVCSGVIAGKPKALIPLYSEMFEMCENSPDTDNIKDQAALHVLVALNKIPNLKQLNLNDGWAAHCAVAGPTQFFESWGFKDRLLERKYCLPTLENGVIVGNGSPFDIVHQFNRIPEWNNILTSKYE